MNGQLPIQDFGYSRGPYYVVFAHHPEGPRLYKGDIQAILHGTANEPTHHGFCTLYSDLGLDNRFPKVFGRLAARLVFTRTVYGPGNKPREGRDWQLLLRKPFAVPPPTPPGREPWLDVETLMSFRRCPKSYIHEFADLDSAAPERPNP